MRAAFHDTAIGGDALAGLDYKEVSGSENVHADQSLGSAGPLAGVELKLVARDTAHENQLTQRLTGSPSVSRVQTLQTIRTSRTLAGVPL